MKAVLLEENGVIVTVSAPGSLVSSSLLALILEDLYGMHLPMYRQEHDPDRFGFPLSRQTMSN